jgi:hypothetical protein
MKKWNLAIALSITLVLTTVVTLRGYDSNKDAAAVEQLAQQLRQAQSDLAATKTQLADANRRLNFLETSKAHVQVTAYALTSDFGPDPLFSNNQPAKSAYAVPKHTLPKGKVLNVALSPPAEHKLHARLNDTLILTTGRGGNRYIARFVDRTAQTETRPVVDVLFADAHQARIWGRRSFYAVNISRPGSPFRQN